MDRRKFFKIAGYTIGVVSLPFIARDILFAKKPDVQLGFKRSPITTITMHDKDGSIILSYHSDGNFYEYYHNGRKIIVLAGKYKDQNRINGLCRYKNMSKKLNGKHRLDKIPIYELLEVELNKMFESFKEVYKEKNPDKEVDFRVNKHEKAGKQRIERVALEVEIKIGGLWEKLCIKTTSFKNEKEHKAANIWLTGLYRAIIQDMVNFGLLYYVAAREDSTAG